MSRVIVPVVGMHRSGTSAIAGALHHGGIIMGEDSDFIPEPSPENPKGFFENYGFRKLNDKIIEGSGYVVKSWKIDIPDFRDTFILRFRRSRLIRRYSSRFKAWGWKDPRTCLTLEFWLKSIEQLGLLGLTKVVYVYRNPFSVAYSLNQRNDLELSQGLQVWYEYNKRALASLQRFPVSTFILSYDSIIGSAEISLGNIKRFLDDDHFRIEEGVKFIDPALQRSDKHSRQIAASQQAEPYRKAVKLYELLNALRAQDNRVNFAKANLWHIS